MTRRSRRIGAILATGVALVVVSTSLPGNGNKTHPGKPGKTAKPSAVAYCKPSPARAIASLSPTALINVVPYSPQSPFSTPIPAKARVAAGSDGAVKALADVGKSLGTSLAIRRWTVPVFIAGPTTPIRNVTLTADWAPRRMLAAPIPAWAIPDPGEDGHMVVIDRARGCEYDFFQARRGSDNTWSANWATRLPIAGSGIVSGPSARASGFGLLGGLVLPEELNKGAIRHALVFSYPYTRSHVKVRPATESASGSDRSDALPMGTRLRLDPSLDLSTLQLSSAERAVAQALQVYGMYLGDTGPNITLYAVGAQSFNKNPYPEFPAPAPYVPLDGIPLDRLQVIEPPR